MTPQLIPTPETGGFDEYTTVGEGVLAMYTQVAGWTLIAVLPTTEVEQPVSDYETWYEGGEERRHYKPSFVIHQPRFLLGRTPEEREMDITIKSAQDANVEYQKQIQKVESDLQKSHTFCTEKVKELHEMQDQAGRSSQRFEDLRSSLVLLEEDIAKIRKAVGEDRMKEILGRANV